MHVHGREKGVNWLKNRLEAVDKILEKRHKTHRNILMSSSILLDCPLLSGSLSGNVHLGSGESVHCKVSLSRGFRMEFDQNSIRPCKNYSL